MLTTLNAPRYLLLQYALDYGYDEREIKNYTLDQLRRIIWHVSGNYDDDL